MSPHVIIVLISTHAGMSALRIAIEKHNLEIVKLLLDYGAMVEFTVTVNHGSFSRSSARR